MPLASKLPGLRRLTRSHPRPMGDEAPYFVAELWFDDREAMKAALKSPEMAETGVDYAGTFDVASMTMFSGDVADTDL